MPTLLEELKQVQPCDDRGLLQILSQRIVQEIIKVKRAACEEVANTLTTYGLDEVYPCDYITEEFLKKLTEGDPIAAISSVLLKAGYPPHLLKIFTKGFDELTDEELQEVLKWTEPTTGIQVHKNTAKYIRNKIETERTQTLQTVVVQELQRLSVRPAIYDQELEQKASDFPVWTPPTLEERRARHLASIPDQRYAEILIGKGPKVDYQEWVGADLDILSRGMILDYITEGLIDPDVAKQLQRLELPEEQGGFGTQSPVFTGWSLGAGQELEEVAIVATREDPMGDEQDVLVDVEYQTLVTTEVSRTPRLTEEEVKEVEKFYRDQGIRAVKTQIIDPLIEILAEKVLSKITCPVSATLDKLVTRIKNLARQVGALREKLTKLSQFLNIASATVRLINNIIDALKVVIAVSGPLIIALSVDPITRTIAIILNKITQVCQKLINRYEPRMEKLDKSLCAAAKGMTFVVANINVIDAFIRIIDGLLQTCLKDSSAEELDLLNALTPINYSAQGIAYRGFELEIRTAPVQQFTPGVTPPGITSNNLRIRQRYAVALDVNKVVILQGPYSFSADADILIDELKYRIDAYLG